MIPGVSSNSNIRYTPLESGEQIEYRSAKKVLNQDDFLSLLITQFSTQDPLNPVTDTAFISQMAEFTTLENAKETQSEITRLRQQSANQEAVSMIGKQVELLSGDDGEITFGTVSKVLIDSDGPKLVVDGYPYTVDKVVAIRDAAFYSQESPVQEESGQGSAKNSGR
ncbi:MAG: flagellar hook capping FlgD N-terminal domain-containing protein [Verrucomicrobiota bacterium]|jgi:flagellar basal-body rod modification protein FlgD|nr:flagellar hook capping FlgD N-terminal domain-containing protein [Verrucomicrobiota bacterium]